MKIEHRVGGVGWGGGGENKGKKKRGRCGFFLVIKKILPKLFYI